jgi:hypothetical protein
MPVYEIKYLSALMVYFATENYPRYAISMKQVGLVGRDGKPTEHYQSYEFV